MTTMTHTTDTALSMTAMRMPATGRGRHASVSVAPVSYHATVASCAHAGVPAFGSYETTAPTFVTRTIAVATNPWLGGSGSGTGAGLCSTTVVDDSTKRIHPGRLEGMT